MRKLPVLIATLLLALTGCERPAASPPPAAAAPAPATPAAIAPPPAASMPPVEPPAPGTPGGLPDDRTPISEAPFTPQSAQGAAQVVQTYYALLAEKRYAEAWALREPEAAGESAFAAGFAPYYSYAAQVGAPGEIEGAAGSLFVDVPVVIYGRRLDGAPLHLSGTATLRRVNNVPGSSEAQRRWRIVKAPTE